MPGCMSDLSADRLPDLDCFAWWGVAMIDNLADHEMCSAAADTMERTGYLADCTLLAADGSSYKISKAVMAVQSRVLGCANTVCHLRKNHSPFWNILRLTLRNSQHYAAFCDPQWLGIIMMGALRACHAHHGCIVLQGHVR
jgi:hypothetical protein